MVLDFYCFQFHRIIILSLKFSQIWTKFAEFYVQILQGFSELLENLGVKSLRNSNKHRTLNGHTT